MLGRAFESLMVSRSRRATGAFYTPYELVDCVATSGLSDALVSTLGESVAERVLCGDPHISGDDRARARRAVAHVTVLDPACGSGAFLVHFLDRLSTLARALGDERPIDTIRRDTLARSIFGVDINPTAVWLCELRLWLAVVIDAADDPRVPVLPLPNLDRNIRVGDALAGPSFGAPPSSAAGHLITRLRERYARATGPRKQALARSLDVQERRVMIATIDAQLDTTRTARRDIVTARRGRDLFGNRDTTNTDLRRRGIDLRRKSARCSWLARTRLLAGAALPFSFPAHFADVAAAGGFDLIVGNPPWVRPHRLAPADRARYRRVYRVARAASWRAGSLAAGAGNGFGAQVDTAALFVERSLSLLRAGGTLSLLVPAKLWRSLAGGGTRQLLSTEALIRRLEDHSEARAVFDASVYPGLLVARSRTPSASSPSAADIVVHHRGVPTRWRTAPDALGLDGSPGAPWILLPSEVRRAFDRVRASGVPMAESPIGRAHLGVKCGLNDAFLVRTLAAVRGEATIASVDGRTGRIESALLRPIVRGEDIVPWTVKREENETSSGRTRSASGRPIVALPPHAAQWLSPWRKGLMARTDSRSSVAWWCPALSNGGRSFRPSARGMGGSRPLAARRRGPGARSNRPAQQLLRRPMPRRRRCIRTHGRSQFASRRSLVERARRARAWRIPALHGLDDVVVPAPHGLGARTRRIGQRRSHRDRRPAVHFHERPSRGDARSLWDSACQRRSAPDVE